MEITFTKLKSKMKTISHSTLSRAHASPYQLGKFAELFGTDSPVTLTRELCLAHAAVFDWDWASRKLLTAPQRAAYEAACAPAIAAYGDTLATALAAYKDAYTNYAVTWDACAATRATALATYHAALATAFFNASQL